MREADEVVERIAKRCRERALELIEGLADAIQEGADSRDEEPWPVSEAFTDLEDHPEEDGDGAFNMQVGHVLGLCEAVGHDAVELAREVEERVRSDGRDSMKN